MVSIVLYALRPRSLLLHPQPPPLLSGPPVPSTHHPSFCLLVQPYPLPQTDAITMDYVYYEVKRATPRYRVRTQNN